MNELIQIIELIPIFEIVVGGIIVPIIINIIYIIFEKMGWF